MTKLESLLFDVKSRLLLFYYYKVNNNNFVILHSTSACQNATQFARHSSNALSAMQPLLIPQPDVNIPPLETPKNPGHFDSLGCVRVGVLCYNHSQTKDS